MADIDISFHYRQSRAFMTKATEVLYGGAAGGGKSFLMRGALTIWCAEIKGLQAYIFRRISEDLFKNHMTGAGSFPDILGPWMDRKLVKWNGAKNYWDFWNGSRIWLCHCQYESDVNKYLGAEIGALALDEATTFTAPMYRFLRGRLRLGGTKVPDKYKGMFPRILACSNPGNVGHGFFKSEFVDPCPPMTIRKMPRKDGGMMRQYIPAKLTDNPTLMANDPDYADRLFSLGDPILVRAMLEGDWNIVAGGALDDVWSKRLIMPRFKIPSHWKVDRSFDWGSTHPFSVQWWAEAQNETIELPDGRKHTFRKGDLINIYEWYGAKDVYENVGLRIGPVEIAGGILARENVMRAEGWIGSKPKAGPADNQIYNVNDSESDSIGQKMKKEGVEWIPADKKPGSRINGLQLVRQRMKAVRDGDDEPGIYFMDNCRAAIGLLPILPRDPINVEDVDTKALDHNFDSTRYKCIHAAKEWATDLKFGLPW